jgi:hypothetical protein
MFSTGLLLSAGATIALAVADKFLEETGIQWIGTFLRLAIPITAMVLGVYFLEHNALLRWLK